MRTNTQLSKLIVGKCKQGGWDTLIWNIKLKTRTLGNTEKRVTIHSPLPGTDLCQEGPAEQTYARRVPRNGPMPGMGNDLLSGFPINESDLGDLSTLNFEGGAAHFFPPKIKLCPFGVPRRLRG